MSISLKKYLRVLVASTLYLVVGFLIDDKFGVFYFASTSFWLLVIVLEDVVRTRKRRNREMA
jgi:hypothetical protein